MSETKTKIAKVVCVAINGVNKFVPIQKLDSISCFYRWVDSCYKLSAYGKEYIEADYYNGSEDDLTNIFLEIISLSTTDHCFNGKFVLERLKFLANEGLHIVDLQNSRKSSFKVTEEEANKIILDLAKKTKKTSKVKAKKNLKKAAELYYKNVKSSVDLNTSKKPAKKLRRDNKGRFTKNK